MPHHEYNFFGQPLRSVSYGFEIVPASEKVDALIAEFQQRRTMATIIKNSAYTMVKKLRTDVTMKKRFRETIDLVNNIINEACELDDPIPEGEFRENLEMLVKDAPQVSDAPYHVVVFKNHQLTKTSSIVDIIAPIDLARIKLERMRQVNYLCAPGKTALFAKSDKVPHEMARHLDQSAVYAIQCAMICQAAHKQKNAELKQASALLYNNIIGHYEPYYEDLPESDLPDQENPEYLKRRKKDIPNPLYEEMYYFARALTERDPQQDASWHADLGYRIYGASDAPSPT